MKNLFFLVSLSLLFMYSCKRDQTVTSSQDLAVKKNAIEKILSPKVNIEKFNTLIAANQARLAQLGNLVTSRSATIHVPADYATIQEAVDHASAGANIQVNSGTYNETVFISTPGLNIKATGVVQVNGGFLIDGANNVKIQKFNIDVTNSATGAGFVVLGVTGGQIVQNTVTGAGPILFGPDAYAGMEAVSANNLTVRDNNFDCEVEFGIRFISWIPIGSGTCHNNTISQNSVSRTFYFGISIEGNSDNNVINGNNVHDNTGPLGIWICGCLEPEEGNYGFCDNNVSKNNNSSNNDGSFFGFSGGFYVQYGGENNTIGPNNTFNENIFGLYFYGTGNTTNVFNNTILQNAACDVAFDVSTVQSLANNTYDCVTSF